MATSPGSGDGIREKGVEFSENAWAFSLWTTRNRTYPVKPAIEVEPTEAVLGSLESTNMETFDKLSLTLRDHFFDSRERARTKGRAKRSDVAKPDAPSRGVLGVRQHHRRDESKILPTTRLGLNIMDIEKD